MAEVSALQLYRELPGGFLDVQARDIHALLGGPSLIELPGRREPPLFVSVLLHGNETTGLHAIQQLLRRYQGKTLPRSLCLFVGNTQAALAGVRRLDGQPDFNRIWPGGQDADAPEARLVRSVWERMRDRGLFASIDVHNNTGINPHYGCINRLEPAFLGLAALFSRTIVYFTRPQGVQSLAFCQLAPAVTVECGRASEVEGVAHAAEFIDAVLRLENLPRQPRPGEFGLFHTIARVTIPETQRFHFGDGADGLALLPDLEGFNFRELPAGTEFGSYSGEAVPLLVEDERGRDVAERYFTMDDGRLMTRSRVMPSMLTTDARVIRQDCLCYLMERMDPDQR
ncbi:hypothetical protein J2T57_000066 [Natronocella acetinitrilica]|uniref:Succinylglutamate desuccinylase/Aspartoacylase catalytic domain-containing protein n=1 Tax=Natronocella acetinitrilica TaxID=414046 RepID=A0AAE3G122_9GAMM|nr:M14 family metallopeptidase [Natronocella acetinitrilica]MCP1672974.1 hypothetical protein [Natronocella acetinitrilica]